jgi:hypothetical protein
VEPTKLPIQWVPEALHTGVKQANYAHLCKATVKNWSNYTSTPTYVHGAMFSYTYRKFNFLDKRPDICEVWPTALQMLCNCLKPGGNYICTATLSTKNSAFNRKFIYAFRLTLTINSNYSVSSIHRLAPITEAECFLWGTDWIFEYNANFLYFQNFLKIKQICIEPGPPQWEVCD